MSKKGRRKERAALRRAGLKGTLRKAKDGRKREGFGPCCRSCGCQMVRWVHTKDFKPDPGKGFYTEWYECVAYGCKTRQVMPSQFFIPADYVEDLPGDPSETSMYEAHFREIMRG